jgi:predicted transcriptional regulator
MPKPPLPKLSPAETEMLAIIWKLGQATVQNVFDNLPATRRLAYTTVQTLLQRLEKKGYLKHQIQGKANLYHPIVEQKAVVRRVVTNFVNILFGGDPAPLMLHLAQHHKLSEDDITRLKELVDNK